MVTADRLSRLAVRRKRRAGALGCVGVLGCCCLTHALEWKECLRQPPAWYASQEARRIAEQVVEFQRESGGWPKNMDMAQPLDGEARLKVARDRSKNDSTIDNGATWRQLRFLGRVIQATPAPQLEQAFDRGLAFLLAAQYENGGWPQFYPRPVGYQRHITFNDDAMVSVLALLRDVAQGDPACGQADELQRARARQAVERGIRCILHCQVRVNGRRTVWCAQHDAQTLAPAAARSYELPSLSGGESVGIVRFLMSIEEPPPEVVEAVERAVEWFGRVQLKGWRLERRPDPTLAKGYDLALVADPAAPPLWARFYEIETQRPFFCGRDGVKKYRLAEIEYERRVGYSWYTTAPRALVEREYPAWRARQRGAPGASHPGPASKKAGVPESAGGDALP